MTQLQPTKEEVSLIDLKVQEWLAVDPNEDSREEIRSLHSAGRYDILSKKLLYRISFGTAGLRSSMESGFSHMNDVTVMQASQGLVSYTLKKESGRASLVVGYDHRHHSQRYAEITASVALAHGLKVYYLGDINNLSPELDPQMHSVMDYTLTVHTPMVPFTIKQVGASVGVMVTASHNPAKDNGYKVYYGNGCQIIPPHDTGIAQSISENLEAGANVWNITDNFKNGIVSGNLVNVREQMTEKYLEAIKGDLVAPHANISFPFVYTPMHGVGQAIFSKVACVFNKNVHFTDVEEQRDPNPDFPSVRFPNPEESGALDLAISKAKLIGSRFVIANDPDADRFSTAVECRDGRWRQLTGNEIGALFAAYVLDLTKNGKNLGSSTKVAELANTYFLNSTVSSQLMKAMARKEGFHYEDTLTGFKWIGNRAQELKSDGYNVPFGYEEAIGYMFSIVDDKDGISAAVVFLQLIQDWFHDKNIYPEDKLQQIYQSYGWFKECNGYYKLDDVLKTDTIFGHIRASCGENKLYPQKIGDLDVIAWRDLTVGYDSTTIHNKPNLPIDPTSQMITALVKDAKGRSARFTCRGSGTEPKLKVYIEGESEVCESDAVEIAHHCWKVLEKEWFKPGKYGLEVVL